MSSARINEPGSLLLYNISPALVRVVLDYLTSSQATRTKPLPSTSRTIPTIGEGSGKFELNYKLHLLPEMPEYLNRRLNSSKFHQGLVVDSHIYHKVLGRSSCASTHPDPLNLMEALHGPFKPIHAGCHHTYTTIRILGKLGGRNTRLPDQEPLLDYRQYPAKIIVSFL